MAELPDWSDGTTAPTGPPAPPSPDPIIDDSAIDSSSSLSPVPSNVDSLSSYISLSGLCDGTDDINQPLDGHNPAAHVAAANTDLPYDHQPATPQTGPSSNAPHERPAGLRRGSSNPFLPVHLTRPARPFEVPDLITPPRPLTPANDPFSGYETYDPLHRIALSRMAQTLRRPTNFPPDPSAEAATVKVEAVNGTGPGSAPATAPTGLAPTAPITIVIDNMPTATTTAPTGPLPQTTTAPTTPARTRSTGPTGLTNPAPPATAASTAAPTGPAPPATAASTAAPTGPAPPATAASAATHTAPTGPAQPFTVSPPVHTTSATEATEETSPDPWEETDNQTNAESNNDSTAWPDRGGSPTPVLDHGDGIREIPGEDGTADTETRRRARSRRTEIPLPTAPRFGDRLEGFTNLTGLATVNTNVIVAVMPRREKEAGAIQWTGAPQYIVEASPYDRPPGIYLRYFNRNLAGTTLPGQGASGIAVSFDDIINYGRLLGRFARDGTRQFITICLEELADRHSPRSGQYHGRYHATNDSEDESTGPTGTKRKRDKDEDEVDPLLGPPVPKSKWLPYLRDWHKLQGEDIGWEETTGRSRNQETTGQNQNQETTGQSQDQEMAE